MAAEDGANDGGHNDDAKEGEDDGGGNAHLLDQVQQVVLDGPFVQRLFVSRPFSLGLHSWAVEGLAGHEIPACELSQERVGWLQHQTSPYEQR